MPTGRQSGSPHLPSLRRLARALTGHRDSADALVQRALRELKSGRMAPEDQELARYEPIVVLCRIYLGDASAVNPPSTQQASSDSRVRSGIERTFQALNAEEKVVLALVVLEGVSYQDVSDILQMPTKSIRATLIAARKKLEGQSGASATVDRRAAE